MAKPLNRRLLRSKRHTKHAFAFKARRTAPSWALRHPGKSDWKLTPPLPGTQVGQDIYIAKTKPAEHGYPEMRSMFALFPTKAKAKSGNPEHALATYDDPSGVLFAEANYGDVYRFHRLVPVRTAATVNRRSRFGG